MRRILGSDEGRQNRDEIRKGKQIPNLGKRGRSRSRSSRRSPSPRQARSPGRGNRRRSESGSPRRKQSPEQFLNLRTGTSYRSSRKSPRQNSSPRQIPSLGKESRCRDRSRSPRRRWWFVVKSVIFLFLAQFRKHVILMIGGGTKATCRPTFANMARKFPLLMRRTFFREAGLNGGLPQYLKGRVQKLFSSIPSQ